MDMYKPPGLIKKIYFRRLTFGTAPFKIDNVWIDRTDPTQVCLEVRPWRTARCNLPFGHSKRASYAIVSGVSTFCGFWASSHYGFYA